MVFSELHYLPPYNAPLYWKNEQSGVLAEAVKAYLDNRLHGTAMSEAQFDTFISYLRYYIDAPCWFEVRRLTLRHLRERVRELKNCDDIKRWIEECLVIGLDPL